MAYPSIIDKVQKLSGGERIIDAIMHVPVNYELWQKVKNLNKIENGNYCCIETNITEAKSPKIPFYMAQKRHIPTVIKTVTFDGYKLDLIFFNFYPKMLEYFSIGRKIVCQGRLTIDKNGKYSMIHPHIPTKIQNEKGCMAVFKLNQLLEDNSETDINSLKIDNIVPIYSLTEGLKQIQLTSLIEKILNNDKFDFSSLDECDYIIAQPIVKQSINAISSSQTAKKKVTTEAMTINQTTTTTKEVKKTIATSETASITTPSMINTANIVPTTKEALRKLHFPSSIDDIKDSSPYLKKMSFLELLSFQYALSKARLKRQTEKGIIISGNGKLRKKLQENLPFSLTEDQQKCLKEIYADQASDKKMLRLLQGDVGSGKTIVALMSTLNVIESGHKVIIMAPTAILAKQHFATISNCCFGFGLSIELLIGETKQKARKEILTRLKLGQIDILIGTHTLFQKKIELPKNIGLFVIDEQHNFGVEQRVFLINKCKNADILMMSATPIPRTMIMGLYGDIGVSCIEHKPSNRLPIDTKIMSLDKYDDIVKALERKITAGEKIYWICPLVEESEKLDYIDINTRVKEISTILDKSKIGIIHGKMSQENKDKIMLSFKNGDINLLIATTVIEVGIDVPDATIIVIENAEKFGLAQLHQLRGRVGRGNKQSYCILLYGNKISEIGRRRLEILRKYDNGFKIAEFDLKLRGSGTLLNKKQSGFKTMNFVNFSRDKQLIFYLNKYGIHHHIDEFKIKPILELFSYSDENGESNNDYWEC